LIDGRLDSRAIDSPRRSTCHVTNLNNFTGQAIERTGHVRETFAVAVESNTFDDADDVRRIQRQVAHEVVSEVDARPRAVVVVAPGTIPKTPSGKLRRAHALSLVGR
jgi:fatty-acyl-CoA synthase